MKISKEMMQRRRDTLIARTDNNNGWSPTDGVNPLDTELMGNNTTIRTTLNTLVKEGVLVKYKAIVNGVSETRYFAKQEQHDAYQRSQRELHVQTRLEVKLPTKKVLWEANAVTVVTDKTKVTKVAPPKRGPMIGTLVVPVDNTFYRPGSLSFKEIPSRVTAGVDDSVPETKWSSTRSSS